MRVQSLAIPRHRTLTDNERMLGRRRSACEEGDAVGRGRRNSKADIKKIRIFAYNRPGQHMVSRESDAYRRKETGNGKDLATTPSEAMACVINMMNDHRGDLGVISESTTTEDERAAVIGRWDLEGYGASVACGEREGDTDADANTGQTGATSGAGTSSDPQNAKRGRGRTRCGVTIVWNTDKLKKVEPEQEVDIIAARVRRVVLETLDGKHRISVYGAYMPDTGKSNDEIVKAWKELREAIRYDTHEKVLIIGDMNAVTRKWVEERGRKMGTADTEMDDLLETEQMESLGTGVATHRGGREIDHIIVDAQTRARASEAEVMPGEKDDHQIVHADIIIAEGNADEGQHRRIGVKLDDWDEAEWATYVNETGSMKNMWQIGGETWTRTGGGKSYIEEAQAMMEAAATAIRNKRKKGKTRRDEDGDEERPAAKTHRASLCEQIGRWSRLAGEAERYRGETGEDANDIGDAEQRRIYKALWHHAKLRKVIKRERHGGDAARAQAARDACRHHLQKMSKRLEKMDSTERAVGERAAVHELERLIATTKQGLIRDVFRILNRARGRRTARTAKITRIIEKAPPPQQGPDTTHEEPAAVRAAAARHGERTLRAVPVATRVMATLIKELLPQNSDGGGGDTSGAQRGREEDERDDTTSVVERVCSWENFKRALAKCKAKKGTGKDGFNAYLLLRAPEWLQRAYWEATMRCIRTEEYPEVWREWIAMLTLKTGGTASDIAQYRDLWLVPHGQKLVMHMLSNEYDEVNAKVIPGSQAGWESERMCAEMIVTVRLMIEQAAIEGREICIGFQDLSTCFMSIVKEIQFQLEAALGVEPEISAVIKALHTNVTGQFETEHGLSDAFPLDRGTGQGDPNGGSRAKMPIAMGQWAVSKYARGFAVTKGENGRVPQLYYADDGSFITESTADLQAIFDLNWYLMKMSGMAVKVKGKEKTAYMAVRYENGIARNIEGAPMRLLDGTEIPQIRAPRSIKRATSTARGQTSKVEDDVQTARQTAVEAAAVEIYKYLGTPITAQWQKGMEPARQKTRRDATRLMKMVGALTQLNADEMQRAMNAAMEGVVGAAARGTVMTMEDCDAIEVARRDAIERQGAGTAYPKAHLYAAEEDGGEGSMHTHVRIR